MVYDPEFLKEAIKAVKKEFEREASRFTEDNRARAKAEYDAAKAKYDEERKRRNSTSADDDRGREDNGVSNRDDNFSDRQGGGGRSSAPKMPNYKKWPDLMKEEVAAERRSNPETGKRNGPPLISPEHALAGSEMKKFIDEFRDKISDARITKLIGKIEAKYLEISKAKEVSVGSGAAP